MQAYENQFFIFYLIACYFLIYFIIIYYLQIYLILIDFICQLIFEQLTIIFNIFKFYRLETFNWFIVVEQSLKDACFNFLNFQLIIRISLFIYRNKLCNLTLYLQIIYEILKINLYFFTSLTKIFILLYFINFK